VPPPGSGRWHLLAAGAAVVLAGTATSSAAAVTEPGPLALLLALSLMLVLGLAVALQALRAVAVLRAMPPKGTGVPLLATPTSALFHLPWVHPQILCLGFPEPAKFTPVDSALSTQ